MTFFVVKEPAGNRKFFPLVANCWIKFIRNQFLICIKLVYVSSNLSYSRLFTGLVTRLFGVNKECVMTVDAKSKIVIIVF